MFCPKCSSLLKPSPEGMSCSCGYTDKKSKPEVIKEKINSSEDEVVVRDGINPMATHKHKCKKCGFEKAVFVESQIAVRETWCNCSTDRPAYICGKCGYKEFT